MKSLLSEFGLIFFALLAFIGVLMVLVFFDLSGIHRAPLLINRSPIQALSLDTVATLVSSPPKIEWKNPLAAHSLPDLFTGPTSLPQLSIIPPSGSETGQTDEAILEVIPTLEPTLTPAPPLEPVEYRTEVALRAKNFAAALESFLAANDRLANDEILWKDPAWRSEMSVILIQVVETGQALSSVGPPPEEYAAINAWLVQIGPEAEGLRVNYQYSLDSGDPSGFSAAGENFNQIKEDLALALTEMSKVGWPLE